MQEIVGKNIRKYRKNMKISQEELALRCNLNRTFISSIERGLKSPSLSTIEKICFELKIEVKLLFEQTDL